MPIANIEKCPKCSQDNSKHASRYVYETVSIEQDSPTEMLVSGIQKTTSFLERNISTANSFTKALQRKASALNNTLGVLHDRLTADNDSDKLENFLSSDAWFSWDRNINLRKSLRGNHEISDVTKKIKSTLIDNADVLELPKAPPKLTPPAEPQKREAKENIIDKISNAPPKEPMKPQEPENKSWSMHFKIALLKYALVSVIISIVIAYLIPTDVGVVNEIKAIWRGEYISPLTRKIIVFITIFTPLFAINVLMAFTSAFFGNRKIRRTHIEAMKEYEQQLDRHRNEMERYEELKEQKERERGIIELEYEKMMDEYRFNLERLKEEYDVSVKLHMEKVNGIKGRRLELWNRLRVCQSCSNVFLIK